MPMRKTRRETRADGGKSFRVAAALVAAAALLGAQSCTTVAKATQKPTQALGELLLPPEQEKELGDELAAQVREQEPMLDDEEVQRWVQAVGKRIGDSVPAEHHDLPYDFSFSVIDRPDEVNAFALPGGHIFVYSGLLLAVEDEAQLAAVLGHEVAHVTLGHPSQHLAAQVGAETLRGLALGAYPGLLTEIASGIAAQGYLAANSRQDEAQADQVGLAYLADAGYDPEAMAGLFRTFQQIQGRDPGALELFFATHPSPGQRVEAIEQQIRSREMGGGQRSLVGGFDEIQRRLSVAED